MFFKLFSTLVTILKFDSFVGLAYSEEKVVNIVAFKLENLVESESKGLFIEPINKVLNNHGYRVHLDILPTARAHRRFCDEEVDILLPATANTQLACPAIKDVALGHKEDVLFYNTEKYVPQLKDISQLQIALVRGFSYSEKIWGLEGPGWIRVEQVSQGFSMLSLGRVDGFIVDRTQAGAYLNRSRINNIAYLDYELGSQLGYLAIKPSLFKSKSFLEAKKDLENEFFLQRSKFLDIPVTYKSRAVNSDTRN